MAISQGCVQQLSLPQLAGTFQPTLQVVASDISNSNGQLVSLSDTCHVAIGCISPELMQPVALYDLVRLVQWEVQLTPGAWMLQISGLHKVGHHQGVIGSPTMDVPLAAEAAKAPAPCAGLRQELQDFALTQPGAELGQMGQMGAVPTPMRKLERAENLYGRRFGEETYHVSVSQCAPNQPGLMEVAAPLPVTHAMDPASPARPMVASASLPHSAVAPAATPMQGLPAATVNARPGPGQSGAASTQPNQAGQGNLLTVDAIAGYSGDNWRLIARVTLKSEKRNWKNTEKEGTIFNVELVDENGVETRGVFFNKEADKFHPILQKGKLYSFYGGRKKKGNTRWCPHKIELTFDSRANIQELPEDGSYPRCPLPHFEVKPLSAIEESEENALITVAGIVMNCEMPTPVACRNSTQRNRQNFQLLDDSNVTCRVTLWGEQCIEDLQCGVVVLLKNARVSGYNNSKSLNSGGVTDLSVDSVALWHPRCQELLQWYRQGGEASSQNARSLSSMGGQTPLQNIQEMKDSAVSLEMPGATDGGAQQGFHLVPVTITHIPHDKRPFYMACVEEVPDEKKGTRSCNKKMEINGDVWQCALGHQLAPSARWICQFSACDHTGSSYFSSFDEVGVKMLGHKADEAARRWDRREVDQSMDVEIEQIFKRGLFKRCMLKVKSKKEIYNDEEKLKYSALDLWPMDFVKDARQKLLDMKTFLAD